MSYNRLRSSAFAVDALAMAAPGSTTPTVLRGSVFVIDDDASVRRALTRQLRAAGLQVEALASAQEYLDQPPREGIACIVTDLRMPGLSGLDLQARSEEHTSELQSLRHLVCRLLLEKKKKQQLRQHAR